MSNEANPGTSIGKDAAKAFEDAHTLVPMVAFDLPNGGCEAFEYLSLARASINRARDTIVLFFGPATVTVRLDTRDQKKDRLRMELYRGFLSHSIRWVTRGGEMVESITVELAAEAELAGLVTEPQDGH